LIELLLFGPDLILTNNEQAYFHIKD